MLIDFRERGREGEGWGEMERDGERNINVREKHQSVASHMLADQGLKPQPRHVP